MDESIVPADAVGLTMTPAEARQLVETFWADSGFEDMVVSGVYLVCDISLHVRVKHALHLGEIRSPKGIQNGGSHFERISQ